jgi:hypothetical protein
MHRFTRSGSATCFFITDLVIRQIYGGWAGIVDFIPFTGDVGAYLIEDDFAKQECSSTRQRKGSD